MEGYKAILIPCILLAAGKRNSAAPSSLLPDAGRFLPLNSEWCGQMHCAAEVIAEGPKCECGVFKFPTAQTTTETPVVAKAPQFNFECNADGKESCSNMCKALAGASRDEGPKRICELIVDADKSFVPVIYYRACDDEAWTYTGLKSTLEICCRAKEVIPCA